MREAVEHPLALCKASHGETVIFLVEEEAGFLPVFDIDAVIHAVFADLGHAAAGVLVAEPALALRKPLKLTDLHIVALENAAYLMPVGTQNFGDEREQHGL